MNIPCKTCGAVLATRTATSINVNGQELPTAGLDGVILRCSCGRTRTYYLNQNGKKPVNTERKEKPQDIVRI